MRQLYLLSSLLIISIAGSAQIKISTKKGVELNAYQTFVVQKGQVVSLLRDQHVNENKVFKTVQDGVMQELTMRGYQSGNDSIAELVVTYVLEESNDANLVNVSQRAQAPDAPNIDDVNRTVIPTRVLIIEIEDRKKNSLWTANCSLGRSQRDAYTLIETGIIAAFKKFPNRNKKSK